MKIGISCWIILVIFGLFLIASAQKSCEPCPSKCVCTLVDSTCKVDCSGKGLTDVPVLTGILPPISELYLQNNLITEIEASTFQNMTLLKEINLSDNLLTKLPDNVLYLPITNISLSRNKWNCDCGIVRLQNWLKNNLDIVFDHSDVLCELPPSVLNQRVTEIDLTNCAGSHISCNTTTNKFIIWEYLNSTAAATTNITSCVATCFSKRYYYALLNPHPLCLCARQDSDTKNVEVSSAEWNSCMNSCTNAAPGYACNREVLADVILRASPNLTFTGLGPYLQTDEVVVKISGTTEIVKEYMWNWNDSLDVFVTASLQVSHKYTVPGSYWLTVSARNDLGIKSYSYLLAIEDEVGGLTVDCPNQLVSHEHNIPYALKRGTNPKIEWTTDSKHQTTQPEMIPDSAHYVSGSLRFNHDSHIIYNREVEAGIISGPSSTSTNKFALIFPGLWIVDEGTVLSWEFVYVPVHRYSPSKERIVRLQIYRPSCNSSYNLVSPGCMVEGSVTPYATCTKSTCSPSVQSCAAGLQFCYFSRSAPHCRSKLTHCNWYEEDNATSPLRHLDVMPSYTLVKEYPVKTTTSGLYQIVDRDHFPVEANDVIGFHFEDSALGSESYASILDHIPLNCKNTSISLWRQSAMLFALNDSTTIDGINYPNEWVETIWCDIRMHYTKQSQGTSVFVNDVDPGEHTYTATVSNDVSNTSVECSIRTILGTIEVSLINPTPVERDGISIVYLPKDTPTNFSIQIVGDAGLDIVANWTVTNDDGELHNTQLESNCSDVSATSVNCSKVFNAALNIDQAGNSTVSISARTSLSSVVATVKVVTEEPITGTVIVPPTNTRILTGTYQEFTTNSSSGTNITSGWVVDGLTQFQFTQPTYNVLFRTPSTYDVTAYVANHVSDETATAVFVVDEMNRLKDLRFVGDTIVEKSTNIQLEITVEIDENIDAEVQWNIDNTLVATHYLNAPHNGPKLLATVEQVVASDTLNKTFASAGNKTVKVVVRNEYDEITEELVVSVRAKLTGLVVGPPVNILANEDAQFKINAFPSTDGCTYVIKWDDGGASASTTAEEVTHSYVTRGSYNISVTADNVVSTYSTWIGIQVYERISGLAVVSDGPTELGIVTTITASLATGLNDATFTYDFGDGHSLNNVTELVATHRYNATGTYNVTVVGSNPASENTKVLLVQVFTFLIESVNALSNCFQTNSVATIEADVPLDRADLFGFNWTFGDASAVLNEEGNNTATHVYSSPGSYKGNVTAYSLLTGKSDSMVFEICIQTPISSVSFNANNTYVKTGDIHTFYYNIMDGTSPYSRVDFGDGNIENVTNSTGNIMHSYSEPGNYTAIFSASNLVSLLNTTVGVIAQDGLSNCSLTTNSEYGTDIPQGWSVLYTATYSGSTANKINWNFGDSTTNETVEAAISHVFKNTDEYSIDVVITNHVDSCAISETFDVYSPVSAVDIAPTEHVIPVSTELRFIATNTINAKTFFWKITPGSTSEWTHSSKDPYYVHTFNASGVYNVTLKAENEASAQYASVEVVVADPLTDQLNVIAYNKTTSGNYGPVNEPMTFEVTLPDLNPISSTIGGRTDNLTFEWRFITNNTIEHSIKHSSIVEYSFLHLGKYSIWVNASNTVSSSIGKIELTLVERINNITFNKLDPPDSAVATGDVVRLSVSLGSGNDVQYTWKPDKDSPAKENIGVPTLFSHTYDAAGLYQVVVLLENPLETLYAKYSLQVQDRVEGLVVSHLDPVQPFYVSQNVDNLFHATVDNGTDVLYIWEYLNLKTLVKSTPKQTRQHTYIWNFTEITNYILMVNATNLVSWKSKNTTVYVLDAVRGLRMDVSDNIVPTNDTLTVSITLESGTDPHYSIDFGDNSTMGSTLATSVTLTHMYSKEGTYEITTYAYNNASQINVTETIVVRDVIVGLDIVGCRPGQYLSSESIYNLSALIQAGTAVQYDWSITYSDGQQEVFTGEEWSIQMREVGQANIRIEASNEIHRVSKNISVMIQEPPLATIRLVNVGKIYVNDTVEIEISRISGTDVLFRIDFGDGNTVANSTNLVYTNIYIDPGDYLIKVVAFNNVDEDVKTVRVSIRELACSSPVLWFVGNGALQTKFYASRKVYLETEISTFGCTAYTVAYKWRVYRQDSCDNLQDSNRVNLLLTTIYTPLLSVPPLTLNITRYCVTNTASYLTTPLSSNISTMIEVVSSPLAVVIAGGTVRYISQSAVVFLDASSSFDPDLRADEQEPLSFSWACSVKPGGGAAATGSCYALNSSASQSILASNLNVGYEYNFTVTASKTGKSPVTAWQSVIIVQDTIPTVTISCYSCRLQSRLKISSAYQLVLLGSSDEKSGDMTYVWEASRRKSSDGPFIPFPLNKLTTTTGNTGRYLVVRSVALTSFHEFKFNLTITVNNAVGYSSLVLFANQPPVSGTCSMTYEGSQVYVLETLVEFNCVGWEDEDISPLIYSILAIRYNGDVRVDDFIIYRGTASNYQAYLPLGFEDNQFDVVIQILIEDQLGTFTVGLNESLNVKLHEEVSTIEWLRNKTSVQLADLQRSSNPQVVADFAAGLITVLNQDSEAHGSSADDDQFESRKEIRNNITQSVASLTTNTFDEIQQVTAVFKQCMKVPSEFQDAALHNISLAKLNELTEQMPGYLDQTSETSFLAVTSDLVGIVSYMVDSVNYHVYVTGDANTPTNQSANSTLSQDYRKQLVETLMASAVQLTDNVLEGKVEGEEPVFFNASSFSSIGGRTTTANMNSTIFNDGCYIQLPDFIFSDLAPGDEIFYVLLVSQQNPYTFGYKVSDIMPGGIANISTRVPTLQFKYPNQTTVQVNALSENLAFGLADTRPPIKLVMAPSNRQFIEQQDTGEIAELTNSSAYLPRELVTFENINLRSLNSAAMTVTNNNTDPNTAVHIMIVFDKLTLSSNEEPNPYLDVYFDYLPKPNDQRYTVRMRLTEELVSATADHRNYTVFLDPLQGMVTSPNYYLNVTSYFESHDVQVGVGVYYTSCQYFNTETELWSSDGLSTSAESLPSVAVCYSDHLTSFGSFVISPPNVVSVTEIINIDFSQNPVALILVVTVFALYLFIVLVSRHLDRRDIRSASIIPLCGPNLPYKYEVTVKTSPGIGSGTTANVGICVYGYRSRTGAKHLYKQGAFQRGSVDVFHVASECSLGTIYKLKVWHDNTGLDPGWSVSRIMVKDLETNEKFYFLLDCWLQVYPDDVDETCLYKTIRAASDEEMSDFSMRFGTQLSYGWEDAHLWLSLLERPPRSSFTRVQRATCCVTLIYMFILFSALWYQDDETRESLIQWKDAAVGAIVSVMVFPINLVIVFLFKKSRCKVSPMASWDTNRAQTAQTVEILDEVLNGRSRKSDFSGLHGPESNMSFTDRTDTLNHLSLKTIHGTLYEEGRPSSVSNGQTSEDTGISSDWSNSPSQESNKLRRRSTGYSVSPPDEYDDDGDFWDPFICDGSIKEEDLMNARPTKLRRTQKAKFNSNLATTVEDDEIDNEAYEEDSDDDDDDDDDDDTSVKSFPHRELQSAASTLILPIVDSTEKSFHFPRFFLYLAYFLCFVSIFVSIFYIILYGHVFGTETSLRWLLSMFVAFLESFFLIEPIKVLFLAIYIAMFTEQHTPEQNDNIVQEPFIETYENIMKPSKVRPPGGFALEQCKDQVKKSVQCKKYLLRFGINLILFWAVAFFCFWDRSVTSYWSSWPLKNALFNSPIEVNQSSPIDFYGIKTDAEMWAWLEQVFYPNVVNKAAAFDDNSNNFNHLMGQIRLRQQRSIPEACSVSGYSSWLLIPPGHQCTPNHAFTQDKATYVPGWGPPTDGSLESWNHTSAALPGFGYWGRNLIYDDSGYMMYLDEPTFTDQIADLQEFGWVDRLTRVCFVEFAQLNPTTHWFTVMTIMFEIDGTGILQGSHFTQTVRLFTPSSAAFGDMFFMAIIGIIVLFLWAHEITKVCRARRLSRDLWKQFNWLNILIVLLATSLCAMFIYKEIYMEEVMWSYKGNRNGFTNFYGIALISNVTMWLGGLLLVFLMIKALYLFRFFRSLSVFGKALSRGFKVIFAATAMLLVLMLAFAQIGYLIFGVNATQTIPDFQDFQNSFYCMFRIFRGRLDTQACFDASPCFSIVFFLSYYFGVFLIFCRLFAAIIMVGYKETRRLTNDWRFNIPEYDVMTYMVNRAKLYLGLSKMKQYRPTVHFDDMSTPSSESSFISFDSLGTCFTPERVSQCSDASGVSSSDSGLGTPSGHSISLFDYLTIEHPPFEKPMDDLHLDYLFDRLSTYSVDMMLRRFERVNKLNDDVLLIESKLLDITQKLEQKKLMQKQSNEIARAVTSTSMFPHKPTSDSSKRSTTISRKARDTKPRTDLSPTVSETKAISGARKLPLRETAQRLPVRSSSYVDASRFPETSSAHIPLGSGAVSVRTKQRPHSDEGVRVSTSKSKTQNIESVIKKKTAW